MTSTIAKNTLYLTVASVFQKVFSFIYFSLLARYLGVNNLGIYATVISFTTIFLILVDMGVTPVLIREGSKDKEKIRETLGQTLLMKFIFGLGAYLLLSLTIFFIRGHYTNPMEFQKMVAVMGIMMILNSFSTTLYGALRSFQNLRYEAMGVMGNQIVIVFFGLLFLWWKHSVILLFVAMGLGDVFAIVFSSYILRKNYCVHPKMHWNNKIFKNIILIGFPFALAGIFTRIYSSIDHVILSYLMGTKAVGLYSLPSKIAFAFQFLPLAFAAALFPAMSSFFIHDRGRLKIVFEKGLFFLAMLALPLSFGIMAIADTFIIKVYGDAFTQSILPLQILVASLFFTFLDFPIGSLLNACNFQKIQTTAMGCTMLFNIILNLLLIPKFSIVGAAIAAFLSNMILFAIGYAYVPKIIERPSAKIWVKIGKIFVAASLMGFVVALLKNAILRSYLPIGFIHTSLFLGILIIFGCLFYLTFLWIFGVLRRDEVNDLFGLIKRS